MVARSLVLTSISIAAFAQLPDPDTAAARHHYQRGTEHYDAGRWRDALDEFTQARHIQKLPALDYDIARCLDRLEEWGGAASAYERYLSAVPEAPDGDELRARVRVLRARVPRTSAPATIVAVAVPPPHPHPRWRAAAAASTALTLAALGAGAGLLGSVAADWPSLEAGCRARPCGPSDWAGAEQRSQAGWALIAIGAAGAIADVALFTLSLRRR